MSSRGIAARVSGEEFVNQETKQVVTFDKVTLFEDHKEIPPEIVRSSVQVNQVSSSFLESAIVASFTDSKSSKPISFIRFVTPHRLIEGRGFGKWTNAQFMRDTGFIRNRGASANEWFPVKPSDLVGDEKERTVEELVTKIKTNSSKLVQLNKLPPETYEDICNLLSNMSIKGPSGPVEAFSLKTGRRHWPAINKYLGEVLAPLYYACNHLSAEEMKQVRIRYFQTLTNPLIDSEIILDGKRKTTIGISSKAGLKGGAATSISSIMRLYREKELSIKNNEQNIVLQILETIENNNQFTGILECSMILGIISDDEYYFMKNLQNHHEGKIDDPEEISENLIKLSALMGNKSVIDYNPHSPNYKESYHILAGMAKKLAKTLNDNINFDKTLKAIFFSSGLELVQMNTIQSRDNGTLSFGVLPLTNKSSFDKIRFVADSSKNFYTTGIKGKLSFKIKEV